MTARAPDVDVLIVGAGISGISMAAHMGMLCPQRSYAIVERRSCIGGTWDLFRYPGVRSDSDMYSLGFAFAPWTDPDAIASGDQILAYMNDVVRSRGMDQAIRFDTRVRAADFREAEGVWHVTLQGPAGTETTTARFLYLASGYYDYDEPHDPQLPGRDAFEGDIVHPQFWPPGFSCNDKRVIVVGSGATAVTLVPAIADQARQVTMLQRTPTWMAALPTRDRLARLAQALLPPRLAYRLARAKNIAFNAFIFRKSRRKPRQMASYLTRETRKALGPHYNERDWLPPYGPWEQRLCLVPDGDFFAAIRSGKADIVTDVIERLDASGIALQSGRHLDADVIITATGLKLAIAGGIKVTLDGVKVHWRKHFYYRSCMFSNVPNLAVVFGYLNASWTLRADATARYVCGVLNAMRDREATLVWPRLAEDHDLVEDDVYDFSSGYIQRARPLMPRSADRMPWRLNQDYREDCRDFRARPVEDGVLTFAKAAVAAGGEIA